MARLKYCTSAACSAERSAAPHFAVIALVYSELTVMTEASVDMTDISHSPGRFSDQSTTPHGVLPAEQGRSLIDEVEDSDVQAHGKLLNDLLLQTYNSSQTHLIEVKKRLIEEKEIALIEAERMYLNQYDQLQSEIRELRESLQDHAVRIDHQQQNFTVLSEAAAALVAKRTAKYSSPASVHRAFTAWAEQARNTRRANKMDLVAKAFARKFLLAKSFFTMCLNSQRRRAGRANGEAKYKFDSVTTDMVTSYESQLQALRDDLKEAYMTIEAEQLRRQQLEEDLRRLFLKNMTAMNFEALSLFQQSHNMVESVHTKPIRSPLPAASPPKPLRRDLAARSAEASRARERSPPRRSEQQQQQQQHGGEGQLDDLTAEEAAFQAQMEAYLHSAPAYPHAGDLHAPFVSAPPAYAHIPQSLRDSHEPRPPLGPSRGAEPASPARYANQISEAYRSATSVTPRLAHNATPVSARKAPSPAGDLLRDSSGSPPLGSAYHHLQHHYLPHLHRHHQHHQGTPVHGGTAAWRSPAVSRAPAESTPQPGCRQSVAAEGRRGSPTPNGSTPASAKRRPFH